MKYRCYGVVSGSIYLGEVEANNEGEAIERASDLDRVGISFCHQCADQCEDPEVVSIEVEPIVEGKS